MASETSSSQNTENTTKEDNNATLTNEKNENEESKKKIKEEIRRESNEFFHNNCTNDNEDCKPQSQNGYNQQQIGNNYDKPQDVRMLRNGHNELQDVCDEEFKSSKQQGNHSNLQNEDEQHCNEGLELQKRHNDHNKFQSDHKHCNEKLESQKQQYDQLQNDYSQLQVVYNQHKLKSRQLQDDYEKLHDYYKQLVKNYNQLQSSYCNEKQNYDKTIESKNHELQSYKDHKESYKTEISKIQNELDAKNKDMSELESKNIALKEEASKYQSALGVAANFRISDDDKNHSVQLKNDIISLQDSIGNYVTNLKGKIEVNVDNVKNLSQKYGITTENPNKSFIKAVLQRYVLDTIIEKAKNYFKNSSLSLESKIASKTHDLCLRLNEFSETRKGTDTITSTSSIKIRQKALAALSNRGFSDVLENQQSTEHNFVRVVSHVLNESMNSYRTIIDPGKKQNVENMATNLIREVVRILWFRLRVQEPIITYSWVPRSIKIDSNVMTGLWEEDDDIDNLVVDLCYFPMIGLNLDDPSKRKLYTRAKIFPRYREKSSVAELG